MNAQLRKHYTRAKTSVDLFASVGRYSEMGGFLPQVMAIFTGMDFGGTIFSYLSEKVTSISSFPDGEQDPTSSFLVDIVELTSNLAHSYSLPMFTINQICCPTKNVSGSRLATTLRPRDDRLGADLDLCSLAEPVVTARWWAKWLVSWGE